MTHICIRAREEQQKILFTLFYMSIDHFCAVIYTKAVENKAERVVKKEILCNFNIILRYSRPLGKNSHFCAVINKMLLINV